MTTDSNPSLSNRLPEIIITGDIELTTLEKELLQKVHLGYQKIFVQKKFGGGFSNTKVLLIWPVETNGESRVELVAKLGPAKAIRNEMENYKKYAASSIPLTAIPAREYQEKDDWAAVSYVYAGGGALGETPTFEEYYLTRSAEEINRTLDELLDKTLGKMWYGQTHTYNDTFDSVYGRYLVPHAALLEDVVASIYPERSFREGDRIEIEGITGIFPDPLKLYPVLLNRPLRGQSSVVHGDLHVRNILVDPSGKAWLIDFAKVKNRHNLFDFIKLETYIRLLVLPKVHGGFSSDDYIEFELALNAATLGQQTSSPAKQQLKKAYEVILSIRKVAKQYIRPHSSFNAEYFPALFLYALSMLRYFSVNKNTPTQLIFKTCCVLAQEISKGDKQKGSNKITSSGSDLPDDASTNNSGQPATEKETINTGGGVYIKGSVHMGGGDFVGRDKYVVNNNNTSVDEIARAFEIIRATAKREEGRTKKEDAIEAVDKLEAEAGRGEQAEERRVQQWFSILEQASDDAWKVAVATLSDPVLGLGTAFRKILQRVKEEKNQQGGNKG